MRLQSSLKWLIDKRARLLGEINSLEKRLPYSQIELNRAIARVEIRLAQLKQQRIDTDDHLSYIAGLRSDLNAIDGALKQHDVQISPESIRPIRPQRSNQVSANFSPQTEHPAKRQRAFFDSLPKVQSV